jgi:hypothetical protein
VDKQPTKQLGKQPIKQSIKAVNQAISKEKKRAVKQNKI